MRVLTIVSNLGPGGTQRSAQNYSMGYQQAGHPSAVLAYSGGGPRAEPLRAAGLDLFIGDSASSTKASALSQAVAWRPDLVHIHREGRADSRTAQILRRLKEEAGNPPVLETNVFGWPDYSPDRSLIDLHLHLSPWCLWKWQRWTSRLSPRSLGVVVPYAVDTSAFFPAKPEQVQAFRAQHQIPPEATLFGRIGQPHEDKWSPIIFEAFTAFAERHTHTYLLVVGLPDSLKQQATRLPAPVRRRIIQVPFLQGDEELRTCYSALDVFLHAARIGESFGMVLTEALACTCPVITLSTPVYSNSQIDVVGHETGGIVVQDLPSMIKAMERLAQDEPLRRRLGKQGQARIQQRYALEHVMERLLHIAELALSYRDKKGLAAALHANNLTTTIDDASIRSMLASLPGKRSLKQRLLMPLVHSPILYQLRTYLSQTR